MAAEVAAAPRRVMDLGASDLHTEENETRGGSVCLKGERQGQRLTQLLSSPVDLLEFFYESHQHQRPLREPLVPLLLVRLVQIDQVHGVSDGGRGVLSGSRMFVSYFQKRFQ